MRTAIDSGKPAQVILLGHHQLLDRHGGIEQFARDHIGADRRRLRPQVIARLKQIALREQAAILKRLGKHSAERSLWVVNAIALSLTPAEVLAAASLPEVEYIYPSFEQFAAPEAVGHLSAVIAPVPRAPFSRVGKRISWNVERLDAPRVWDEFNLRGEGVTVAVLDGGANYAHSDLRQAMWRNPREVPANGVDDDHNGYVDDYYGYDFSLMRAEVRDTGSKLQHGTLTSGMVGGDGSRGIITGVAPRSTLMLLISGGGPIASALAYQYALENGADIVSMSFSIPNLGNLRGFWRMMSEQAIAAGVVLVGGAGNFQQSANVPYQNQSPKDVPSVISVGGIDTLSQVVPFSSLGPVEWETVALYGDHPMPRGFIKPDLVAFPGPGYAMLATNDTGYIEHQTPRGNSFSGPQGAGVAALMLSAAPGLPAWEVKPILEATAHDLDVPGKDNRTGAGLLNAYRAVAAVRARVRPMHWPQVSGTYATTATLVDNSCATIEIHSLPTKVSQPRGDSLLVITHGPNDYSARLDPSGRFVTEPKAIQGGASTHTLTIEGQIAARRLTATVRVAVVTRGASDCRYRVVWNGSRID